MTKILAIDTSCDDTSIAVVEKTKNKINVLSNVVSSQVAIHQPYGGVYPTLAKREHEKNLPLVLKKVLRGQGRDRDVPGTIDAVAVTVGPGLEPCLWMGINFAKKIAKEWNLPIIPINHIEAHLIAGLMTENNLQKNLPAIALIVSGGHTQLILVKAIGKYKIIGETRDDAAGECFDKTARILGLSYPGGPEIAAVAAKSKPKNNKLQINLPRPMLHSQDYDFSFSGLKTAVLYDYKKRTTKTRKSKAYIQAMAREIQQSICDVLIKKTIKAVKDFKAKTVILGGGVSANQELRKQLQSAAADLNLKLLMPKKQLATDNAAMIGLTALFHQADKVKNFSQIKANANLRI